MYNAIEDVYSISAYLMLITSPPTSLLYSKAGKPVCIMVEGKKNAIAVGITELSTADM